MPIHDWTRVEAGIFHDFHHEWIARIKHALNQRLPSDYYALAEQVAAGFGPDVLTLQGRGDEDAGSEPGTTGGVLLAAPRLQPVAETDRTFHRRRQNRIAVRHVSGDRVVAMVEIVSPGNKASRNSLREFVDKASQLLDRRIHLLILDLFPPGPRDPGGIHAAIWGEVAGQDYALPAGTPLTLASYESGDTIRAYVIQVAVGAALEDMPLFLEPEQSLEVPLEDTYRAAFAEVPRRWRQVLEGAP
jgi:hypothetical protein